MEEIRKRHNTIKRDIINRVCSNLKFPITVLDVGCGRGGDIPKWKDARVAKLYACDPDRASVLEARSRNLKVYKWNASIFNGTIEQAPLKYFDIICYNFSLQYIFQTKFLFNKTIYEIAKRMKAGSYLIGVIPDAEKIIHLSPITYDGYVQCSLREDDGRGNFGEKLYMYLKDTRYYENGPISEPMAYKDVLVSTLYNFNIELKEWNSMDGDGITKIYSTFIFVKTG